VAEATLTNERRTLQSSLGAFVSSETKMPFCERPARAGFQISFEGQGCVFLLESKVGDEIPGSEFGSVRRIATVVVEKAFFEIVCGSGVLLTRVGL
jgi:hypothetical protein